MSTEKKYENVIIIIYFLYIQIQFHVIIYFTNVNKWYAILNRLILATNQFSLVMTF